MAFILNEFSLLTSVFVLKVFQSYTVLRAERYQKPTSKKGKLPYKNKFLKQYTL